MKKTTLISALAVIMLIATAAIAYAANEYTVGAEVTGREGTKKRPAPVTVDLNYKVAESTNPSTRPSALDKQTIFFEGIRINTIGRKCTASTMNRKEPPSDSSCSRSARLATGYARNLAGPISNRQGPNARCYLSLALYNAGGGKLALFVEGAPSENEDRNCPLEVSRAIPVNVRNSSRGATISLSIPDELKVPAPNVRNALVELKLNGQRKTARQNGRTRGIFESFGCTGDDRDIRYTFDNEDGPNITETAKADC